MPLFQIDKSKLSRITQSNFDKERVLQTLIEKNLDVVFNCKLVASEFITGAQHAGRIDSLAISEDSNPVIIEYKKVEASDLINQSLFYLSWLNDHQGDFEIAAQKTLGPSVEVDWSDIRVICIAPNYKKYDLHAVQVMGANIELWSYRLFDNSTIYLEEIYQKTVGSTLSPARKQLKTRGKKDGEPPTAPQYSFEYHVKGKPKKILELANMLHEFIMGLDPSMEHAPKKLYIAYRISQNIVCMETQRSKILLFLKLNPKIHSGPKSISRDVSQIGHFGTGDLEISVRSDEDFEAAKNSIIKAYQEIGG